MPSRASLITVLAVLVGLLDPLAAQALEAKGAGATFPKPLYDQWAKAFRAETGLVVGYAGTGSGNGLDQAAAGTVDFGGSDMPVAAGDLARLGLVQVPTVVGGILPIVNLDGIDPGGIVLDGPTLAAIFSGAIVTWDAPAIARLNPGLVLPRQAITVVSRSDASGTTFVMTNYLAKVSADWRSRIGSGTSVRWPVGVDAKGSDGMVQAVAARPGAIGYVEYSHAKRGGLTYLNLVNADGRIVQPTPSSFAAASAAIDWSRFSTAIDKSLTNQPGGASWPITTATFVLIKASGGQPDGEAVAARFFRWALANGASIAEDLDYVPLVPDAAHAAEATLATIPSRATLGSNP